MKCDCDWFPKYPPTLMSNFKELINVPKDRNRSALDNLTILQVNVLIIRFSNFIFLREIV